MSQGNLPWCSGSLQSISVGYIMVVFSLGCMFMLFIIHGYTWYIIPYHHHISQTSWLYHGAEAVAISDLGSVDCAAGQWL